MICWCPMFELIGWHQLSKKPLQIISCQELSIHSFQVTGVGQWRLTGDCWVVTKLISSWCLVVVWRVKNGYPGPEIIHLHVNLCRPRSPRSPCYLSMWVSEAFSRTITESPGTTGAPVATSLSVTNIYYCWLLATKNEIFITIYWKASPRMWVK